MSYSADRKGTAIIEVETLTPPPPTTVATRRVKTHGHAVIWLVTNYADDAEVNVCLTNFTPHHGIATLLNAEQDIDWPLPNGNCTGTLAPGASGTIVGIFRGTPGHVYDYEIRVNGVTAEDPQLEI
jgi:hypothetical protein